jgi:hypothetical protein
VKEVSWSYYIGVSVRAVRPATQVDCPRFPMPFTLWGWACHEKRTHIIEGRRRFPHLLKGVVVGKDDWRLGNLVTLLWLLSILRLSNELTGFPELIASLADFQQSGTLVNVINE